MAYYAALASLLRLTGDIIHHNTYPDIVIAKQEAMNCLHEKLCLLHSSLQDYSSKGGEANDVLERRIRDAAYKAQDDIESHISSRLRSENEEQGCDLVLDLEELITEVDLIVDQVTEIKKIQQPRLQNAELSYDATDISSASDQETNFRHTVIGFDDQIMAIKKRLCSNSSKLQIIPIVGTGGIGKTTLAKSIFNDKLTADIFTVRVWVTVSQDYDRLKILNSIQFSLDKSKDPSNFKSEAELTLHVYQHLKGRRYLIIFDDVWSKEVLDDVKVVLPNDNNGSRIVLTTRLLHSAHYTSPDNSNPVHQMSFLNTEESWNLLRTKVFEQGKCPNYLEDIGRFIAEKCRGLPLAIVVIAGVLQKVENTRREWDEIARNVSSIVIESYKDFSKILYLSYNHLPHHLKPCFLYLGGFLHDRDISASRLAMLWIAEGFIEPIESKTLEQVALENLEDLVRRNLVSIRKEGYNGKAKSCRIIHDLLRELCVQRVELENFFHITDRNGDFNVKKTITDTRRASLCYSQSTCNIHCIGPNTRTVLSLLKEEWMQFFAITPSDTYENSSLAFASSFKLLRVWDAFEVKYNSSFPLEVLELIHLRFLAFRLDYYKGQRSLKIPKMISNLRNLQTLIIVGQVHLPSEIWKMKQLRHLIANRIVIEPITGKNFVPGLVLENLHMLSELKGFVFASEAVEMMPNLRILKVIYERQKSKKWDNYRLERIVRLSQLETLELYFQTSSTQKRADPFPENFTFPEKLKRLSLHGCRLPWGDMRAIMSLPNLEVLKLKCSSFQGGTWELDEEDEFPRLRIFVMDQLDIKRWVAENTNFPSLEKLKIYLCMELNEIPLSIGDISTLKFMYVDKCTKSAEESAMRIQEEQENVDNESLQIRVKDCMW